VPVPESSASGHLDNASCRPIAPGHRSPRLSETIWPRASARVTVTANLKPWRIAGPSVIPQSSNDAGPPSSIWKRAYLQRTRRRLRAKNSGRTGYLLRARLSRSPFILCTCVAGRTVRKRFTHPSRFSSQLRCRPVRSCFFSRCAVIRQTVNIFSGSGLGSCSAHREEERHLQSIHQWSGVEAAM
jgi:hypothetical protein